MSSHSVFLNSGISDSTCHEQRANSVRSSAAAYIVFFLTLFTSMAAAAAAVVSEAPLMVVGLY
jgi:hypothetical protein